MVVEQEVANSIQSSGTLNTPATLEYVGGNVALCLVDTYWCLLEVNSLLHILP